MIDFDIFYDVIREKGPTCPMLDCGHAYCLMIRTIRHALDEGDGALVLAAPGEIREELGLTAIRRCRECGCTDDRACIHPSNGQVERCAWAEPDLCTACMPGQPPTWIHPPRIVSPL
jgi:hypothetical protein